MDEKNIALLGFVSKAADYLKDQIDEDSQEIKEVGEIDLEKIKDELSKKLGSSFDGIKNKKDDLISAGREVFDDFISSGNMIDEFKDIFNVDFKEKNDEKDEHIINHLMEILNEPQNEDTNEYEQIITKATSDLDKQEAKKEKEVEIFKDDKQDEEIDSLFSEIVAHENGDTKVEEDLDDVFEEEPTKEEINKEDDTLTSSEFKRILEDVLSDAFNKLSGNVSKLDEENKEEVETKDIEEIDVDEILKDITDRQEEVEEVIEEELPFKQTEIETIDEDFDVKEDEVEDETKANQSYTYEVDSNGVLRKVEVNDIKEEVEETPTEELVEETQVEEEPKDFLDFIEDADLSDEQKNEIKDILDMFSDDEGNVEEPIFEETDEEKSQEETEDDLANEFEDLIEDVPEEEVIQEDIIEEPVEEAEVKEEPKETLTDDDKDFLEKSYIDDYNNRPLEELYISNPGADLEDTVEEKTEEPKELEEELPSEEAEETLAQEPVGEESDFVDDYISSLMNDLSKQSPTDVALEEKQKEQEAKNKVYESIKSIYPYLSDGFIKGVYDLKDSLANDYKEGEKIVILHRLRFSDLEGLRRFVEVIMAHDYLVNVDEKQMIVDTFKEHVNSDGKILTDIFEVANQAKLLTGEYDGYRILKDEE